MNVKLLPSNPKHGRVFSADIEAITLPRRAVLLDLMAGDTGATFEFRMRDWLIGMGFARPTGLGHRTLSLTSKGKWYAEAVMVHEADRLMRDKVATATGCA